MNMLVKNAVASLIFSLLVLVPTTSSVAALGGDTVNIEVSNSGNGVIHTDSFEVLHYPQLTWYEWSAFNWHVNYYDRVGVKLDDVISTFLGNGVQFTISDMDWINPPSTITGIISVQGSGLFASITADQVSFTDHSVTVDLSPFSGGDLSGTPYIEVQLQISPSEGTEGPDLSPWKNATGANTGLTPDVTLSASPLQDLVPVQVDVPVCNYGDQTITSTLSTPIEVKFFGTGANLTTDADINDDTKALAEGVLIAPGACSTVSFTWIPDATQGVTQISALVNPQGFIIENVNNNLTTRAVTFAQQPPSVPEYSCERFYQPFDDNISIKKKSKGTVPVKMELKDEYGYPMTDADISAPPVINVTFNSTVYGNGTIDDAALESVGSSNDGNQFSYNATEGQWEYRLGTKQFSSAGTYQVTVASGNSNEYTINSGAQCTNSFVRQE